MAEAKGLGWPVGRFLTECLEPNRHGVVLFSEAWEAYEAWCREQSLVPVARAMFQTALDATVAALGIDRMQSNGHVAYLSASLRGDGKPLWTAEQLSAVAGGPEAELPDRVAKALLAHERWKGRTEEAYDRAAAKTELEQALADLTRTDYDGAVAALDDAAFGQFKAMLDEHAPKRGLVLPRLFQRDRGRGR